MTYEVYLKPARGIIFITADKMECEPGYTVFYARPGPGEKFQEVKRIESNIIAKIKETP